MKLLLLIALLSPAALAQVRVEQRLLVKDGHLFVSAGGTWLERNDYYSSPGVVLSAVYYPRENDGLELRTALFASSMSGSAGVVARLGSRGFAQLDLALLVSREQRTSAVLALGALPLLTFGFSL